MSTRLDQAQPCIFAVFRDRRIKDGVRACQYDLVLVRHAGHTSVTQTLTKRHETVESTEIILR